MSAIEGGFGGVVWAGRIAAVTAVRAMVRNQFLMSSYSFFAGVDEYLWNGDY
jgi:hypothetical protein